MTTRKVRYAIVGAGGIAQSYAQAFEDHPEARLVAIADLRLEAAQAMSERFQCPSYTSYKAMANEGAKFDAVIVSTPPNTHEEITLYFLERKIHVLCEKPLCTEVAGARRMVQAAQKSGAKLSMGSKFRYVDDVIRAKSIVTSGILGEIILFENTFASRVDMSTRWNANPEISGGGVLIDNGAHSVDLMRYFLGPLSSLQVVEGKRAQGLAVEDTALILARSDAGVMGRIDLSWSLNKELPSFINIYGTSGVVSVGWKESKYRQSSSPDWIVFGKGYDKVQAFRSQIQNFSRATRGEEALLITADDALASVEAIETAYEALRRENWVRIAPKRQGSPKNGQPESGAKLLAGATN